MDTIYLELVFSVFYIFHRNKQLKKVEKMLFLFYSSSTFSPVSHCRIHRMACLEINPKVYDVIMYLIRDLKTLHTILRSKEGLILKLGQFLKYYTYEQFPWKNMFKVCTRN